VTDFPLISIVTPSYQQAAFLEQTMQSVLRQQYPCLEYVVVDGGSKDGSAEIVERYADELHWWTSEPDDGQYDAINKGFWQCTGEIMAWLNSDDLYFPWTLHLVAQFFAQYPEVQWISGGVCGVNVAGQIIGSPLLRGGLSRSLAQRGCYQDGLAGYLSQEGMFWRRSLWEASGATLNTSLHLAADFELWQRFSVHAKPVAAKCILAAFRHHPSSQRSVQFKHQYCAEVHQLCKTLRSYPRVWDRIRNYKLLSQAYNLCFTTDESTTLDYDVASQQWQLHIQRKHLLNRPLVSRRKL
jgi:hypothetical protein